MGSRYLLLEFDDEAQALSLRAQIDNATRAGKRFRVVGLFAKPTHYCECDPNKHITTKVNPSKLKRGRKFGWWVCVECGRPSSSLSGLVNLVKPRDIIKPPKWMSKHHQRGSDFETMHYITNLSGLSAGPQSIEYWNNR